MQFLCYVTFSNADSRISIFFRNFERPFTPRTWPVQPPNFGKTRFGRFLTFHFSTPKNFFRRKIWIKNFVFRNFHEVSEDLEANRRQNQLYVKFCSGYTRPEVCATRNHEKKGRTRPPPALLPRLAPGLGLARAPWLLGCVCVWPDSDKY